MTDEVTADPSGAKPVVAAIDGTELGRFAALWAGRYADAQGLSLLLAHAGDVAMHLPGERTPDPSDAVVLETVAWLRRHDVACDVEAIVRSQSPESLLEELSDTAALMVVGDRGDGVVGSVVHGSTGHHVAGHARCAVVLIPASWGERSWAERPKITVGVSTSDGGRRALEFAVNAAAAFHATVHAVRCWDRRDSAPGADPAEEKELQLRVAHGQVAMALHRCGLRAKDVDVTYEVIAGPVSEALRDAAAESDLLVLGTRFRSGGRLSRLGFTTSRLSFRLPCPVVIVGPAETVREPGRGSIGVLAKL